MGTCWCNKKSFKAHKTKARNSINIDEKMRFGKRYKVMGIIFWHVLCGHVFVFGIKIFFSFEKIRKNISNYNILLNE